MSVANPRVMISSLHLSNSYVLGVGDERFVGYRMMELSVPLPHMRFSKCKTSEKDTHEKHKFRAQENQLSLAIVALGKSKARAVGGHKKRMRNGAHPVYLDYD